MYRDTETFCLRSPLSGTARYSVRAGRASFTLDVHGFPPETNVGLDWINNPVRGYLAGAFTTNTTGSYAGVARAFRPGEVRAIAIRFERSNGSGLGGDRETLLKRELATSRDIPGMIFTTLAQQAANDAGQNPMAS